MAAVSESAARQREERVLRHLFLVDSAIRQLRVHLPPPFDRDDLHAVGVLGLVAAAQSYQARRNASFKTYAYLKIRGAILDELRARSALPRGQIRKLRRLKECDRRCRKRLGRGARPAELAAASGLAPEEVQQLLAAARASAVLSLDVAGKGQQAPALGEILAAPASADPAEDAARAEQLERLAGALAALAERDRQVLVLYYHEELLLKEIGEVLGVSESRVCQLHARALRRLRRAMERQPLAASCGRGVPADGMAGGAR
ncbi:MAG: sigma 28 (flagella/sporulation) [Planctomycetota bacterium]|nr:MAG: sigma 28 (flagella/sporulation) [Planctomycetota bacterium]